jgi:RNA polymerase sigma-70 factor (ECF subfamily)
MSTPSHNPEACHELFARLSEYLDHELDLAVCDHIEQHLQDCPKCQVCVQTLRRTIDLCRNTQVQPLPNEVADRLRQWLAQVT